MDLTCCLADRLAEAAGKLPLREEVGAGVSGVNRSPVPPAAAGGPGTSAAAAAAAARSKFSSVFD